MRKKKIAAKWTSVILSATMAVGMLPYAAFAKTSDEISKLEDGTYTGSATVESDNRKWDSYTITSSVTVSDGKITAIGVTADEELDEENQGYLDDAIKGWTYGGEEYKGVVTQILETNSTDNIDTVSEATIASNAIVTAVDAALDTAPEAAEDEEEAVYVMMNIPYEVFYGAIDSSAEQEKDSDGNVVDAISTATTSKFKGTTGLASGTYNDGTAMQGVYYPVAMDQETYEALSSDDSLTVNDDYYFYVLDSTPSAYLTLTYGDGSYSFDAADLLSADTIANEISVTELTYDGGYGDYQITLDGVYTNGTDADGNSIGLSIGGESVTIAGALLETGDGETYAMYALNNLWYGTRITYVEIAWSVIGGQGICRGHGSGDPFYEYDMNGKTLTGVTLITDKGIYEVDCDVDLAEYYTGEEQISVEANDGDSEISVSVPSVFANPTVTVSYKSGRSTVTIADAASIVDGKVTLDEAIDCASNGSYTITVNSDNYAPSSVTLETLMTEEQKETLAALAVLGSSVYSAATGEETDYSRLKEHLEEAEALLANEEATSSEAAELIGELEEYVVSVRGYAYVMMNVPYASFYGAIDSSAEQEQDSDGNVVDAISTATTSKFKGTTGLANGTYNDGTNMRGVYYPVKMDVETCSALAGSGLTVNDDYYFYILYEDPSAYLTLTYTAADEETGSAAVYSYDAADLLEADSVSNEIEVTELTYTGGYGDYQISLEGVYTNGTDAEGSSIGLSINGESVTIAGALLETSDGETYAMYALNNLWYGTRVTYVEIAWSVIGGQGICRGHGSGDPFYEYDMNGKMLTGVTLITDKGIYEVDCNIDLAEYYTGEEQISVEANDGDSEISVSVPSAFTNPTVTVTYKSGRSTVTIADAASIVDGKVTLEETIDCETNGSYTITVNSDNYAPAIVTLDTLMTDAQKETLSALIEEGEDLLAQLESAGKTEESVYSQLKAHVAEAEELLENAEAMSSEAGELIGELEEYVAAAKELVATLINGVCEVSYGVWAYYVDGVIQENYTGFQANDYGTWYIVKGYVAFGRNDVIKDVDSDGNSTINGNADWWYVVNGKVQTDYTGVANYKNDYGWWYIKDGKVDFTANTVAKKQLWLVVCSWRRGSV